MLTKDLSDTIEEMTKQVVKHLGGAKALHDFAKGKIKTEYVFGEPNSDNELAKAAADRTQKTQKRKQSPKARAVSTI